jgi:hypothetical protein
MQAFNKKEKQSHHHFVVAFFKKMQHSCQNYAYAYKISYYVYDKFYAEGNFGATRLIF